jgi:hypothetical protein
MGSPISSRGQVGDVAAGEVVVEDAGSVLDLLGGPPAELSQGRGDHRPGGAVAGHRGRGLGGTRVPTEHPMTYSAAAVPPLETFTVGHIERGPVGRPHLSGEPDLLVAGRRLDGGIVLV